MNNGLSHDQANQPDTMSDDQFDAALDAMLRGDRSPLATGDPAMATTLDQLLAWAAQSGFAAEAPSQFHQPRVSWVAADDAPRTSPGMRPDAPVPIRTRGTDQAAPPSRANTHHRSSRRPIIVSTISSLAAILLLGLTLSGAIPALIDRAETPTAILLAGADGTQLADSGTSEEADSATEHAPVGVPGPNADGIDVLTSDECAVAPISRADATAILRTPPGEYGDRVNMKMMRSGSSNLFAELPLSELNAVFREWQACVKFGETWQYMALQTDYMTRADIYGPQLLSRPALGQGYSNATLEEILNGRVLVDQQRRRGWLDHLANGGNLPSMILVLDETGDPAIISISDDGTYIANVPVAKLNQANGERIAPHGTVDFELVDGHWRIAAITNLDF